jgi:hypothetical protein
LQGAYRLPSALVDARIQPEILKELSSMATARAKVQSSANVLPSSGAPARRLHWVALHLPMLAMAHSMGNHLHGMPMDPSMWVGMALIVLGVPAAIYGALPKHRAPHGSHAGTSFEAPDTTRSPGGTRRSWRS